MKDKSKKTPLFTHLSSDLSDPQSESDSDSLEVIVGDNVASAAEGNVISSSSWTPIDTGNSGKSKAKEVVRKLTAARSKSP